MCSRRTQGAHICIAANGRNLCRPSKDRRGVAICAAHPIARSCRCLDPRFLYVPMVTFRCETSCGTAPISAFLSFLFSAQRTPGVRSSCKWCTICVFR
uniref:Uncharacterized protein n=1 Tax=Anopheles atroparvus TaxID=41427 RepID=A0AAG5DP76_ANOAO